MLKLTHSTVDIAIVCSDFEKSLHFYHHCLGLEVLTELDIPDEVAIGAKLAPSGFRQVRLQVGNTLIKLMELKISNPLFFVIFILTLILMEFSITLSLSSLMITH